MYFVIAKLRDRYFVLGTPLADQESAQAAALDFYKSGQMLWDGEAGDKRIPDSMFVSESVLEASHDISFVSAMGAAPPAIQGIPEKAHTR
jgi:hypothetical protein